MVELSYWNYILVPIYFGIILFIANRIQNKKVKNDSIYRYFTKGIFLKLLGSFAFCMVYSFYYNGGDTNAYFDNSKCIANLFYYHPKVAFSILQGDLSMTNHHYFSELTTGRPHWYMFRDPTTFAAGRFTVPFTILGAKTFIPTSFVVCFVSYIGIWKLFKLFAHTYPKYVKQVAICVLFIPSFIFWGSGIMKDTYIVGATCWITYNFYSVFIKGRRVFVNGLAFVFNLWVILTLKPYVLSALLLAMVFWLNSAYLNKIKNGFIRFMSFPLIIGMVGVGSIYMYSKIGNTLGEYGSIDSVIEKAKITQEDLLREEQYGSNSYNLGKIDGSASGLLGMAPLAIFTAIYRPSLVEIGSPTALLSVIENTILLIMTLVIIFRVKYTRLRRILVENPLIQYSLIFSIIMAFGIGLATANFGALVRYKIPLIPFYFTAILLIWKISKERNFK